MRKYYREDIWKLNNRECFADKATLEEYLTDNWEEYARPIGDEFKFVRLVDNKFGGIDIVYEVMDYDPDTGQPGPWMQETESLDLEIVELTHKVSDI